MRRPSVSGDQRDLEMKTSKHEDVRVMIIKK